MNHVRTYAHVLIALAVLMILGCERPSKPPYPPQLSAEHAQLLLREAPPVESDVLKLKIGQVRTSSHGIYLDVIVAGPGASEAAPLLADAAATRADPAKLLSLTASHGEKVNVEEPDFGRGYGPPMSFNPFITPPQVRPGDLAPSPYIENPQLVIQTVPFRVQSLESGIYYIKLLPHWEELPDSSFDYTRYWKPVLPEYGIQVLADPYRFEIGE